MLQACATVSINVREGVLNLTQLAKDFRNGFVAYSNQFNYLVVFNVPLSKLLEMEESRIGISEHSVTVSGDNSSSLEGLVDILHDGFLVGSLSSMDFLY